MIAICRTLNSGAAFSLYLRKFQILLGSGYKKKQMDYKSRSGSLPYSNHRCKPAGYFFISIGKKGIMGAFSTYSA